MIDLPRHQCLIYDEDPSFHIPAIARSIRANLAENKRCLYFNTFPMLKALRDWLTADGFDIAEPIASGALLMSTDREQLVDGIFETQTMMNMLQDTVKQALADGYAGIWSTGDVFWELGNKSNFDKLADYERQLDVFMSGCDQFSCVCQYNRNSLPPQLINTALTVHPGVYISNTLSYENTFYRPS